MKYLYVFALLGVVVGLIACDSTVDPTGPNDKGLDTGPPGLLSLANVQSSSIEKWSERSGHQVVVFDDGAGEALYLMGGYDNGAGYFNDVYKSTDGSSWTQVTDKADWRERTSYQVVVFKEALYLMGGSSGRLNDVWKSTDGNAWTPVTSSAPWGKRNGHQVVVFDDGSGSGEALYLLGGSSDSNRLNDVWKSTDGSVWEKLTPVNLSGGDDDIWPTRYGHQVVVFNGALYLMGGSEDGSSYSNDVWTSTDGSVWEKLTPVNLSGDDDDDDDIWPTRYGHQVVVFKEALYLMGGYNGGFLNDVWTSTDGSSWTQVTADAPWSKRRLYQVVVYDNGSGEAMYLMGGRDGSNRWNDVWRSTDGEIWEDMDDYLIEEPLGLALDEDEDIYLLGTNDNRVIVLKKASSGTAFLAEFSDTLSGTLTDSAVFSSDNVLYIVGGKLDGAPSNSIYAYDTLSKGFQNTGLTLPQEVFGHHLQVLNDCVYLLNGTNDSGAPVNYKNCDFSFLEWTELTSVNDADITNFASLVSGSRVYLVGGQDPQGKALNATYFLGTDDELIAIPKNDPYGLTSSYGSTGIAVSEIFLLLGGEDAAGALNADVYQSVNGGEQWSTIKDLTLETDKNFVVQTRQEPLTTLYVYGQRQNSLEGDIFYTIELQKK